MSSMAKVVCYNGRQEIDQQIQKMLIETTPTPGLPLTHGGIL